MKNKIYHNVEQFKTCSKISLKQKKDTPSKHIQGQILSWLGTGT